MARTKQQSDEPKCSNCKYWRSDAPTRFEGWGTCEMSGIYNDALANRDTKMVAVGKELWSRAETSPEFGCVMFEAK